MLDSSLHSHTPTLNVIEPRGLRVRSVRYHRTDPSAVAVARIERQEFDPAGRPVARWDARLTIPCQTTVFSLSGIALRTESVDAGWRLQFVGDASQPLQSWDGRNSQFRTEFDNQLRPIAHFEKASTDTLEFCVERLSYGGPEMTTINACGRLLRHDDSAGTRTWENYGLLGAPQSEARRFLLDPSTPNWPVDEGARDALLEPTAYSTAWAYDATGAIIQQVDARGNAQLQLYTVGGSLASHSVRLAGGAEHTLVYGLVYNASGQVQSQTAGNGVLSTAEYDDATGRLTRFTHLASEGGAALQDLAYTYDPVGNVTSIEDRTVPQRYWKNHRSDGLSTYLYDTLYQLVQATGRESAAAVTSSISRPVAPLVGDGSAHVYGAYTQTYDYDAAGNMTRLQHTGLASYTQNMVVSDSSNRSLCQIDGSLPPDLNAGFDANGNQLELESGAIMSWNPRNQLNVVTFVQRKQGRVAGDDEVYCYGAGGARARKIRHTLASKVTNQSEVRYLPGLELHTDSATGESFEVINAQAGCVGVRVLRWSAGRPVEIPDDQVRYNLNDHLGSITLELDSTSALISSEGYYPYGATAWWTPRSEIEAKYKTRRYSGKERDATGLYYFGQRYYAPSVQRWVSPDPAGDAGGMNRYQFVTAGPMTFVDPDGCAPVPINSMPRTHHSFGALRQWAAEHFDATTDSSRAVFWMTGPDVDEKGRAINMLKAQEWARHRGARTLELTEGGEILNNLLLFEPGLSSTTLYRRMLGAWHTQMSNEMETGATIPVVRIPHIYLRNLTNAAGLWDIASIKFAQSATGVVNAFAENASRAGPWGLRTWMRLERPTLTGSVPNWDMAGQAFQRNDSVRMIVERNQEGGVIAIDYRRDTEPRQSLNSGLRFVREAPGRLERAGFLESDRPIVGPRNIGVGIRSPLPEPVFAEYDYVNEYPQNLVGRGPGRGVRPGPEIRSARYS